RPSSAFVMKSGRNFSGYCRGPYVFAPRVIRASTPNVRTYASTCSSPPAFEAEYGLDVRNGASSVHAGAPGGTSPYTSCVGEQHLGAEDVREDELGGTEDRPVDVRLRREVDDRVAAAGRTRDRVRIGDVALVELVLDVFEVGAVAGVRELVEDDDLVAGRGEPPREVRADEAGAAGDEDPHAESLARQARSPSRQCGSSGAPLSERRTE